MENKHIFYNYDYCLLNVKQMTVLCGDTIYKCCKFMDLLDDGDEYTLYLKNERDIKYAVCVFKKSGEFTVRTTDVEMRQLLQYMVIIQQQQGSLCYHTIMEIFLKKGYYLSKNVFKLLRIFSGSKAHMVLRWGTRVSYGGFGKNSTNSILPG
jgi:hypothetical protein